MTDRKDLNVKTFQILASIHNSLTKYYAYTQQLSISHPLKMGSTSPEIPKVLADSLAESKAEYKQLGKSGLRVSVPILGAMSFGHRGWLKWVLEEEEALPVLKAAYDRGLNTWDTSNNYSNGISEQIIAKAIKKYNIPRRKITILTKCYGVVAEEPETFPLAYRAEIAKSKEYVNQGGRVPGTQS